MGTPPKKKLRERARKLCFSLIFSNSLKQLKGIKWVEIMIGVRKGGQKYVFAQGGQELNKKVPWGAFFSVGHFFHVGSLFSPCVGHFLRVVGLFLHMWWGGGAFLVLPPPPPSNFIFVGAPPCHIFLLHRYLEVFQVWRFEFFEGAYFFLFSRGVDFWAHLDCFSGSQGVIIIFWIYRSLEIIQGGGDFL